MPAKIANNIHPKYVGKVEVELADGKIIKRKVYEVEIEVENSETGEKRKTKVLTTVEKRAIRLSDICYRKA